MKYYKIGVLYVLFCLISTALNLSTQRIILASINYSVFGFIAAILLGTIIGLLTKYYLDKKFIFIKRSDVKDSKPQFIMYATTGIATTSLFWGIETVFWLYGKTQLYREIGAIIGLFIGYVAKYNLDKSFVFKSHSIGRRL